MEQAIVNLIVSLAIILAIAMVMIAACTTKEKSSLPSSEDGEMIKHISLHTMRIEALMANRAQTLAEEIVRKYKDTLAQAESLPVVVRFDNEASNELLVKAADLLIKRGWFLQIGSQALHMQVAVVPTKPRHHRENPRRKGVYGGARYW